MDPPGPYSASNPPPETSVDVSWPWNDVNSYTIQNYQTYMNDYFKPEWYNTY